MRCAQVQELFSELYDGIAERQADLAQHLLDCPACELEYKRYSQLLDELRQLPGPELPAGFHESVMGKIRALALSDDQANGYKSEHGFDLPMKQPTHDIDDLSFVVHKGHGSAKPKHAAKKAASISRRWAGVAAAACVLLMSLWAVRVFDLPGARLADSATYNMAMPQAAAETLEPEFDMRAGVAIVDDADDEAVDDVNESSFYYDAPQALDQHQVAWDDDGSDYDDMIVSEGFAQVEASAPPVGEYEPESPYIIAPQVDFADELSEWESLDNLVMGVVEEEYTEPVYRWSREDHVTINDVVFAPSEVVTFELSSEELTVSLPLSRGIGINAWDIAFVAGVVTLVIAIVAALLTKASTKQSRHPNETHPHKKG